MADRGVRLARYQTEATLPCRRASSSSDCAFSPFGSTHFVSLWARCHAISNKFAKASHRARGDEVEVSGHLARPCIGHGHPLEPQIGHRRGGRKSARSLRGSFRVIGRPEMAITSRETRPEPMSHQVPSAKRARWAPSRM